MKLPLVNLLIMVKNVDEVCYWERVHKESTCMFVCRAYWLIVDYIYHSTTPASRIAGTNHTMMEVQVPLLSPSMGTSSTSPL